MLLTIAAILYLSSYIALACFVSSDLANPDFLKGLKPFFYFLFVTIFIVTLKYMIEFDKKDELPVDDITKRNLDNWIQYLFEVVSLFCIGSTVSALSTSNPPKYAALYLLIICLFSLYKMYQLDPKFVVAQFVRFFSRDYSEYYSNKKKIINQELRLPKVFMPFIFYMISLLSLILVILFGEQAKKFKDLIENWK